MNTDRWYYRVFQSAPDLIRALLPGLDGAANALGLDPGAPGDRLYRFQALEIKELSHRLDGVLWPRESTGCAETGSPEFPVVLLEVQMHPDPGFHGRLSAQSLRFVQRHPKLEHLEVVVIAPPPPEAGTSQPAPTAAGSSGAGALDQPGGTEPAAES